FSESPSHLNHETYRRYERDIRYLFSIHPDEMPNFLPDAITSPDANEALFRHFRIADSVDLHLMRLSWENAFWIALILIPVLSVLFGRFLSELLYPWYVGWRRGYLSWRYRNALARLERDVKALMQPPTDTFVAEARKAAAHAHVVHRSVCEARRWMEELGDRLYSATSGLIQEMARSMPGFDAEGGWWADSLEKLTSFSVPIDEILIEKEGETNPVDRITKIFDRISETSGGFLTLALSVLEGPWIDSAQECLEADAAWRRDCEGLQDAVIQTARAVADLGTQTDRLAQYEITETSREHPLGIYAVTVRDSLLAWKRNRTNLQETTESLQKAEDDLFSGLLKRSGEIRLKRILANRHRLNDSISLAASPEQDRPALVHKLARLWGRRDFVPRIRRDGFRRWLRPPDILETVCLSLFFVVFLSQWTQLRRFCAFFLLGLDRLLGG
ncbi:MAG: hypothetical protein ABIH23_11310, partial [bacterium]